VLAFQEGLYCMELLRYLVSWVWRSDDRSSHPGGGWEFFYSTPCPSQLWGPPSILSNGTRGSFPGGKAVGVWSWLLTFI